MKTLKTAGAIFLLVVLVNAGSAFGADVTAGVDVNSAYVWRGQTFNDGLVVQPSVDVTAGNFGFNVWGNLDVDDYDGTLQEGEFSEIDLTLTYAVDAGPVGLTFGYIEYLFPTTDETIKSVKSVVEAGEDPGTSANTREIFLDVCAEPAEGFSLGITAYYDVNEVEDYYLNPYIGYSVSFDNGLGIELGASAGYVGDDISADGDAGFQEYTLTLGLGYEINDMISVSGTLGYTDTIDEDVLPDVDDGGLQDVNFFGGVGIAVAF